MYSEMVIKELQYPSLNTYHLYRRILRSIVEEDLNLLWSWKCRSENNTINKSIILTWLKTKIMENMPQNSILLEEIEPMLSLFYCFPSYHQPDSNHIKQHLCMPLSQTREKKKYINKSNSQHKKQKCKIYFPS